MKTIAAVVLALSGAAIAIAEPMSTEALPTAPPEVQQHGAVSVLNGGVGEEEVRWFKAQSAQYPLQVVISGKGGEYGVADSLTVRQGNDEVVTVPDAGPWVMMALPPGRYTVEATFDGRTEKRNVQLAGKGVQRLNWNTAKASE